MTVVAGRQLHVTVVAFSCWTTTQCSISSAVGGGIWLRMGGGVAATGCFFAAQPASSRQNITQAFLMTCFRSLVPACRWRSWLHAPARRPCKVTSTPGQNQVTAAHEPGPRDLAIP